MKTFIVICEVDEHERNEVEGFNNQTFEDFTQFINTSKLKNPAIFDIENFVYDCNNQVINLENYWLTYIHIKDHRL